MAEKDSVAASARHRRAARAFDMIAADYDAAYGPSGNAAMAWMRQENLAFLRSRFPPVSRLLEVGCGTGEEAVALAATGRTVLASDISPAMVRLTLSKAVREGVGHRVQGVVLPAGSLEALVPSAPFDGVYTSFGALNCEPDLVGFGRALQRLVRPEGTVICGVMGRIYVFEILWYLVRGQPRRAVRRLRRGWDLAPVAGNDGRSMQVPTRYLSRRQVVRSLGPQFSLEQTWALPLLMPPPFATGIHDRYPNVVTRLARLDRVLRTRWPFRCLGDHLILVFRRRAT